MNAQSSNTRATWLADAALHRLHAAIRRGATAIRADAEAAGDDLVKFFEECGNEQKERARRAQQLLVAQADDDEGDEES
jgi:hypothetical protein